MPTLQNFVHRNIEDASARLSSNRQKSSDMRIREDQLKHAPLFPTKLTFFMSNKDYDQRDLDSSSAASSTVPLDGQSKVWSERQHEKSLFDSSLQDSTSTKCLAQAQRAVNLEPNSSTSMTKAAPTGGNMSKEISTLRYGNDPHLYAPKIRDSQPLAVVHGQHFQAAGNFESSNEISSTNLNDNQAQKYNFLGSDSTNAKPKFQLPHDFKHNDLQHEIYADEPARLSNSTISFVGDESDHRRSYQRDSMKNFLELHRPRKSSPPINKSRGWSENQTRLAPDTTRLPTQELFVPQALFDRAHSVIDKHDQVLKGHPGKAEQLAEQKGSEEPTRNSVRMSRYETPLARPTHNHPLVVQGHPTQMVDHCGERTPQPITLQTDRAKTSQAGSQGPEHDISQVEAFENDDAAKQRRGRVPAPDQQDLDYDTDVLFGMKFEELQAESFDNDLENSASVVPGKKAYVSLRDRFGDALRLPIDGRRRFFAELSLQDWTHIGTILVNSFETLNEQLQLLRQRRREIAEAFEREVGQRYADLMVEDEDLDSQLRDMKRNGRSLMETPQTPTRKK